MRVIHILAFLFLALWLIISGLVGLGGFAVPYFLAVILNLLILAAGILFLVSLAHHHHCEVCEKKEVEK